MVAHSMTRMPTQDWSNRLGRLAAEYGGLARELPDGYLLLPKVDATTTQLQAIRVVAASKATLAVSTGLAIQAALEIGDEEADERALAFVSAIMRGAGEESVYVRDGILVGVSWRVWNPSGEDAATATFDTVEPHADWSTDCVVGTRKLAPWRA